MLNESFRQLNRFALSLGEEELLRIRTRIDNLNYLNGVCLLHKSRFYKILQTAFEIPANIYLFKVNNGNIGKRCEICSELTAKTPDTVFVFLCLCFLWRWGGKCLFASQSANAIILTRSNSVFFAVFDSGRMITSIAHNCFCFTKNYNFCFAILLMLKLAIFVLLKLRPFQLSMTELFCKK